MLKVKKSSTKSATLAAGISVLMWCTSGVCFRIGSRTIGPMGFLFFSCFGGALILTVTLMM